MRIGELAKEANCNAETIRYYEKSGLLEAPNRTSNGYRQYDGDDLDCLMFIRHCRSLQIGLPEVRVLLKLKKDPATGCNQVDALLERQIERVQAQMAALQDLERQLIVLRDRCSGHRSIEECGILKNLQTHGPD